MLRRSSFARTIVESRSDPVFVYGADPASRSALHLDGRGGEDILLSRLTRGIIPPRRRCREVSLQWRIPLVVAAHSSGLLQERRPCDQFTLGKPLQSHRLSGLSTPARPHVGGILTHLVVFGHLVVHTIIDRLQSPSSRPSFFPADSSPLAWGRLHSLGRDLPGRSRSRSRRRTVFRAGRLPP